MKENLAFLGHTDVTAGDYLALSLTLNTAWTCIQTLNK